MNPMGSSLRLSPQGHGIDTYKHRLQPDISKTLKQLALYELWNKHFELRKRNQEVFRSLIHLICILLHCEDENNEYCVEQEIGERHCVAKFLQLHSNPFLLSMHIN